MTKIIFTDKKIVFKITTSQLALFFNSPGICDYCNAREPGWGYLIPLLNSYYCENCYLRWRKKSSRLYPEDIEYQAYKIEDYENRAPVTKVIHEQAN